MQQSPERGDSERGELKMLPEISKAEVFDHVDNTGSDEKSMMPASTGHLEIDVEFDGLRRRMF